MLLRARLEKCFFNIVTGFCGAYVFVEQDFYEAPGVAHALNVWFVQLLIIDG